MVITTDYNSANMLNSLNSEMNLNYLNLVDDMIDVCKNFLTDVREQLQDHSQGTYLDQTTQLRNSLAAYIYRNGSLLWADEGENGEESRKIISDQIHFTPHGFDIIGIASKEYASWVESKGYNVITNQGEWFFVNLGEVFSKLGYKKIGSLKITSPIRAITTVKYD